MKKNTELKKILTKIHLFPLDYFSTFATLRDHATGNPPAEAILKHFDTWHGHVRAIWAYDNVCNGLDHNVSD